MPALWSPAFDRDVPVVRAAATVRARRAIRLLDACRSGIRYRPRLKYDAWSAVADEMATRMSRLSWPRDVIEERAALIPIPLAPARKRQRGYNQSALIARALGRHWRIPMWEDAVIRSRETSSQTRLTPEQRLDNVAGSFVVKREHRDDLRGRHVVLVDDVVTTAATLNTCAKALYEAGVRIISYVTFGRAHASGDRL